MIKEAKGIDFYTTGKEPSKEEFALISEWIRQKKLRSKKTSKKKVAIKSHV
jgi:hypothetical protein